MIRVYRIQDREGRGPFKPGRSATWCDEEFTGKTQPVPSWLQEFGADLIERLGRPGESFGSAVRQLEQLEIWFSPTERQRLAALDYHIVSLAVTRILAESAHQVVFARKRPLNHGAIIVPWRALP